MVQAIINIDERTNQILNVIKAKYALRDKSQAIQIVVNQYGDNLLEPELRPEYIQKAKKIIQKKAINVGSVDKLKERLGI